MNETYNELVMLLSEHHPTTPEYQSLLKQILALRNDLKKSSQMGPNVNNLIINIITKIKTIF